MKPATASRPGLGAPRQYSCDTVVVGQSAAAQACLDRLLALGRTDVLWVCGEQPKTDRARGNLRVLERHEAVHLLTRQGRVIGLIALDARDGGGPAAGPALVQAQNVVIVGDPGWRRPAARWLPPGSLVGLALRAGARGRDLHDVDWGLVCGCGELVVAPEILAVMPRFVSTDQFGEDETEFLNPFFPSPLQLSHCLWRKFQDPPFRSETALEGGSSYLDVLIYIERVRRSRKPCVDLRGDPSWGAREHSGLQALLCDPMRAFLQRHGAIDGTPAERLRALSPQTVARLAAHGIDIFREPVALAVAGIGGRGGIEVDGWGECGVRRLFVVGEASSAGRGGEDGGGPVEVTVAGALRCAERICAAKPEGRLPSHRFLAAVRPQLEAVAGGIVPGAGRSAAECSADWLSDRCRRRAALCTTVARHCDEVRLAYAEALDDLSRRPPHGASASADAAAWWASHNSVVAQAATLSAVLAHVGRGGGSTVGALVLCGDGEKLSSRLSEFWRMRPRQPQARRQVRTVGPSRRNEFTSTVVETAEY